ncbi:MAG: hypothetical protein H0U70_00215 [Tatlockia sp.]|nr:hypothetical protein [Tatlockia sp.]
MPEYSYKNFKIHYKIHQDKTKKNLYAADGYISSLTDNKNSCAPRKFHTEYTTRAGVQNEIKRLMENYIDFEWQEYYEIHGGNAALRP